MELCFEQTVPAERETLFRFHEDPAHLGLLLAEWPGFRLLRHAGHIQPGAETWVEQRVAGCLPVVMGFRHDLYEPGHRFGETMIHGPFSRFSHIHEFDETSAGTIVRDMLNVELAWQFGGALITRTVVEKNLHAAFAFRHCSLLRLVESDVVSRFVMETE
ncbi:SRPBCC family protein [Gimesia sp.]|uniref:SRPBCC family protein n=1 Tax=Gimesia sp. TaxID=2024833 RepID=UPI003A94570F